MTDGAPGPTHGKQRDLDQTLDRVAREAALVVKGSANPAFTVSRFLVLFGDSLQSTPERPA